MFDKKGMLQSTVDGLASGLEPDNLCLKSAGVDGIAVMVQNYYKPCAE